MSIKMMKMVLATLMMISFFSCVRNKNQAPQGQMEANSNVFEVKEVLQSSMYTYMNVKENMTERWVAVGKQDVAVGDVYYYDEALQMTNFHSKELNQTFDVIYFVNQISKTPISGTGGMMGQGNPMMGQGNQMMDQMPPHSGKVNTEQNSAISLEKAEGELTVGAIYGNPGEYSGKEIVIRGIVVKVNKEIMGRNWIHIQDGTSSNGNYDLTLTTQDVAEVNDEVTFKGTLSVDKDFGSGYSYEVIVEDAALVNKKPAAVQL